MNDELLKSFVEGDCDLHAQLVLLAAIKTKIGTEEVKDFTFNRFNVHLDFGANQAVIDDELNPADGVCRLPLDRFASCVKSAGNA